MLASLALVSLLQAPTLGADGLALADARLTFGILGPTRTDAKVRPGDNLVLSFEIQGITPDAAGKAVYTTAVEVTDAAGKSLFRQEPRKLQEFLALGGNTLSAFAHIDLGPDSPVGEYTLKVTVTDQTSSKTASITQKFEVLPKSFDIARIAISADGEGLVPISLLGVGQPYWVHAAVVGFERAKDATKQPKVALQLRVLDENGKPVAAEPFKGMIDKDIVATTTTLPFRFFIPLNRPGKYWVEIAAMDGLKKGTTAVQKFPLTVLPVK